MIDRIRLLKDLRKDAPRVYLGKFKINIFILRQYVNGRDADEIEPFTYREPTGEAPVCTLDELADDVIRKCEEYAEGVGGLVRFSLRGYVPERATPVCGTVLKTYSEERMDIDNETGMATSELDPSMRGGRRQDMRKFEVLTQLYQRAIDSAMNRTDAELARTQKLLVAYQSRALEQEHLTQKMLSQAKTRELMERDQAERAAYTKHIVSKILANLPIIMQWFAGGDGATVYAGSKIEFEMVKGLIGSLTGEQQAAMISALDPAQQNVMMQIRAAVEKDKENLTLKEAEKIDSLVPSLTSG